MKRDDALGMLFIIGVLFLFYLLGAVSEYTGREYCADLAQQQGVAYIWEDQTCYLETADGGYRNLSEIIAP